MKLKEFDFKLPRDEVRKKKIIFTSISATALILIITIASTFAYYQSIENQNPINMSVGTFSSGDIIFAVTIDGVPSNNFPAKGEGYISSSVMCDKGASGKWNNSEWTIAVSNLTESKTTCNIAFINEVGTLTYKIKQQGGGASAIEVKGNPAFNVVPTTLTSGIYAAEDEYGTSYYYRGERNSLNNNLIFAGFQWKIVRINGDSSVRIIYNGVCSNNECTINSTGAPTQIKNLAWNSTRSNDAKYVGYMYGGANGNSSASKVQAQINETSANVKIELENWYTTNIEEKGYDSYISDTLFCNDRRTRGEVGGSDGVNVGYGTNATYYAAYYRLYTNKTPTLICGNKNDKFTINDIINGNGILEKPIGLISADEVALAGGVASTSNNSYYLYTNQIFWSISPSESGGGRAAIVWLVSSNGSLYRYAAVDFPYGLRSVLNLKSGTQVTGDGSVSNPFKII